MKKIILITSLLFIITSCEPIVKCPCVVQAIDKGNIKNGGGTLVLSDSSGNILSFNEYDSDFAKAIINSRKVNDTIK